MFKHMIENAHAHLLPSLAGLSPFLAHGPMPGAPVRLLARLRTVKLKVAPPTPLQLHSLLALAHAALHVRTLPALRLLAAEILSHKAGFQL